MIVLETPRLILRTFEDSDLEAMLEIDQDPKVCEFLPGLGNLSSTKARIERAQKHYQEHGFSLYAVELKPNHEFIGFVGLMIPSFEAPFMPAVEIGWRLASKHWNQGYATEAAKYVLNHAFHHLDLKEVVSFTAINNLASRRVMEKIGLTHDSNLDFRPSEKFAFEAKEQGSTERKTGVNTQVNEDLSTALTPLFSTQVEFLRGSFDHPNLPENHPLRRHVLYRITAEQVKKKDFIDIQEYDPNWPVLAQTEMARLKNKIKSHQFPWFVDIVHIGSTAVPGLAAKPVLDLAIGVRNLVDSAKKLIPILIEEGYVFWETNPDKTKLFFAKGMPPIGETRTHHVHVMEITRYDWLVRPLFRDYLATHPDAKQDYEKLKQELAVKFRNDRELYTSLKTDFILKINHKAVKPHISFAPLEAYHFPLLHEWFNQPHVQEFYSLKPWTLREITEKFKDRVPPKFDPIKGHAFLAGINETPIAYLQCYAVKDHPWEGQAFSKVFVEKAVGLDFFIGDPSFLGKEIADQILEYFIQRKLLKTYPQCERVVVDPEIKNQRGVKFFRRNEFYIHQHLHLQDDLGQLKEYLLMVRMLPPRPKPPTQEGDGKCDLFNPLSAEGLIKDSKPEPEES